MRRFGKNRDLPPEEPAPESMRESHSQAREAHPRWWLIGTLVATILLGLGIGHIVALVAHPLALIVLGITIAAALAPVVDRLAKVMNRVLAVILVYIVLIIIVAGIGAAMAPLFIDQTRQVIEQAPEMYERIREWIDSVSWLANVNLLDVATSQASNVGKVLLSVPVMVLSSIVDIGVVLFISIYWLITAPSMRSFIRSLYPPGRKERVDGLLAGMGRAMGGYVRGSVIDGVAVGLVSYIGFLIIGVNYSLVLALIAGILELIPTLGPLIAGALAVLVALLQDPVKAIIVLIFAIGVQQLENHVLVPNVMRTQADISPLLVIIALLIGSTLGGLLGVFVSIPIAAAANVVMKQAVAPAIRRSTGAPPAA